MTREFRVALFGQQFEAFFRWLPLDRPSDRRHGLVLCGLIPSVDFDDQARAIPPALLGNDIVSDLIDRGILTEDPTLRFRDPRVRGLTLRVARLERVREWEAGTRPNAMTALEMPIALVLCALAVFLYLTQRDPWITITGLVGAAASATPWMTRMATTLSGTSFARTPTGSAAV